ncbi:MAG: S-formylglutathione hydrolase, partial [Rhodobacteraceae bacterium]|nr:S-formylglutathione hydrolase [Paracoccaceae bacterium]
MDIVSENKMFDGVQGVYKHKSTALKCSMNFAVFTPNAPRNTQIPVLWFLSGLTCTHENAMLKAGMQKFAQLHKIAIVFPDTSPRGKNIPDDDSYDLGQGAGFYLNATQSPWKENYQMWDYLISELPSVIEKNFNVDISRQSVMGHSMGGHGALTLAMTYPDRFKSLSALAPIANPTQSDWGKKQLAAYLGPDQGQWAAHDASLLMATQGYPSDILIDQGGADQFLELLRPASLAHAMTERAQPHVMRM